MSSLLPSHLILSKQSNPYEPKPTFFCHICMENQPIASATELTCSHKFCKDCLQNYLHSAISNGKIEFQCFFPTGDRHCTETCGHAIPSYLIQMLVSEEMWTKYRSYAQKATNPRFRECPYCGVGQEGCAKHPHMQCVSCDKEFCFFHSNEPSIHL